MRALPVNIKVHVTASLGVLLRNHLAERAISLISSELISGFGSIRLTNEASSACDEDVLPFKPFRHPGRHPGPSDDREHQMKSQLLEDTDHCCTAVLLYYRSKLLCSVLKINDHNLVSKKFNETFN